MKDLVVEGLGIISENLVLEDSGITTDDLGIALEDPVSKI